MTARSTNEQLLERQEEAANLLSEGWPGRHVVKTLAEKYGVSPQQARSYVREGRQLLVESVAPQDRAFMFAQVLTCLQQDRMDAKEAGNISAQVGASKAMVNHLKQIAHIDPMRDFEHAFIEAAARQTGRPPRTHIIKEERAQRLEQELNALGEDAALNELTPF
jgi:hypothetical protein